MAATYGAAGRMAAAFIHSKLTPLFILASMALGALAVVALPREEEPQIIVPMVDVFVEMPGATPADVEQRVTRPMEQLLWEVPGVEYVYSTSSPGQSMVVVRFTVGRAEGSGARSPQSEAGRECRSHPARRHRADRQAALDRRCADPGRHGVVGALRRRSAAIARRATARRHRRSQRRVRGDPHRRAPAAGARGHRSRDGWRPTISIRSRSSRRSPRTNVRGTASGPVAGGQITGLEAGNRLRTADDAAQRRRQLRKRASRARARRGGRGRRRRRAHVVCHLPVEDVRRATGRHHRRRQAQGHQRHRRRPPRRRRSSTRSRDRSCRRTCTSPSPATTARPPPRRATSCCGTCCSRCSRCRR